MKSSKVAFIILMGLSVSSFLAPARATSKTARRPIIRRAPAVIPIKNVRTIYVRRLQGDRVFARRLMNEMRGMSLRFVRERSRADAILDVQGTYADGAFSGLMKFWNRDGKIIWQARATRPRSSNYMAYSRLADKLRAASKP